MDKSKIKEIINQYEATGRVAFYHPRKKTISLNGFPELPENEAIRRMLECINDTKGLTEKRSPNYQYRKNFFCS